MNIRQIKAIEQINKKRILEVCPYAKEESGIYVFYRIENNIKHAYIGQAQNLLKRLAQHLSGYEQHIDRSIKKHKLYSIENQTGYKIIITPCDIEDLNFMEQQYIVNYSNSGHQLLNKTTGSQGVGKKGISENRPSKGYHDGLKQGYKNAQKELTKIMQRLNVTYDDTKKLNCRAYEKYKDFINIAENGTD